MCINMHFLFLSTQLRTVLKPRLRTLIIDDQPENSEHLQKLLKAFSQTVHIEGIADTTARARDLITRHKPDLLFLDVELGDGTGFELLEQLPGFNGHTVFVTAYEKYAVRAFRANAIDYLLKPVDPAELSDTIDKVLSRQRHIETNADTKTTYLSAVRFAGRLRSTNDWPKCLMISSHDGMEMVDTTQILFIEADNTYSTLHLKTGKKLTSSRPLLEYEDMLNPVDFFRIHRSYLVHAPAIKKIHSKSSAIELKNGVILPVSRRKMPAFNQFLRGNGGVG